MLHDSDQYEAYYGEKLWSLLPEVYRADDAEAAGGVGPLRELLLRIGAQAAIVRREIDRLWEDQSIETCDSWVIPYIGDLLATNLVSSHDARGQRVDVAKTIYYRRRKGTLAVLEEIASDITSWDAHIVEFFRRLGRTRHGLDPEIGRPADTTDPAGNLMLQRAELLTGLLTGTEMGGLADLRSDYGASRAGTSYDEFFHTADVRRGLGATGWYGIPKLGVFLWRLRSFGIQLGTPVPCPAAGLFTFDPTGRRLPLFARAARTPASYGEAWVSPQEWQLPGPLSTPLLVYYEAELYPDSVQVLHKQGSFWDEVDPSQVVVHPELGTFRWPSPTGAADVGVGYHYGFSSTTGAGPFDRRLVVDPAPIPAPVAPAVTGGGSLAAELGAVAASGTVTIGDSLTYDAVADVSGITKVTIRASNRQRPVIRLDGATTPEWALTGNDGELVLDGLFLSGADLVLRGSFTRVRVSCCTLDPGESALESNPPAVFAQSVDGRDLAPSRLIVEANIEELVVERCVLGGIRARSGGEVETLTVSDSILHAIRTSDPTATKPPFADPARLFNRLREQSDPLSAYLHGNLPQSQGDIDGFSGTAPPLTAAQNRLASDLGALVGGSSLYTAARFALVELSDATLALANASSLGPDDLIRLNRLLLEEAYPLELADRALALGDGAVDLERCTVLGGAYVHRLVASECILDDTVVVEDLQHGCVRFTAYASDSVLPRKYECATIAPHAAVFETRVFGRPSYCQLTSTADQAVLSGPGSLSAGGPEGSELGAFAAELGPIRERSLRLKLDEFMPIGLSPVLVYVT